MLKEAGAGLEIHATGEQGVYDIRAAQYVGTVVGPNLRVIIEPKVAIRRLLYLLRFLPGGPSIGQEVELGAEPDLLSVMQTIYAHALDRALEGGLIHDYRMHRDELAMPRGRIDILRVMTRRYGLFPPLECEYSEFTSDIEVNRRLAAAARLLTRVHTANLGAIRRLRSQLERFEGVRTVEYSRRELTPLALDRRARRYGSAPSLAHLVLSRASMELHEGRMDAVGVLVNMDEVYEHFVGEGLREALGVFRSRWLRKPVDLTLDEGGEVTIKPDIVWLDHDGSPRLVLDAKYKSAPKGPNADFYQMLAYCTALGLRTGILLYAHTVPSEVVVREAGVTIHSLALDPDGEPEALEARLGDMAAHIRELSNDVQRQAQTI